MTPATPSSATRLKWGEINHNGKDSHSDKTGLLAYSSSSFIPTMERFRAPLRASVGGVSMEVMGLIKELEIPVPLNCKLEEVTDGRVIFRDTRTSERIEFPADTVLLAVGMAARSKVADSLRRSAPETEVFVVGDGSEVASIATAVRSAFKAAAYI